MKKTILFCTGESGSGKSYFIKNTLPKDLFYCLKSATTRPMRKKEVEGREYYFRDEDYFYKTKFATFLWVNEKFWTPDKPKWLYGVPEFEIFNNLGNNFIYDVIQPIYVRDMINWFKSNKLDKEYNFKTLYFLPNDNKENVISKRANMPDDKLVRANNTCMPLDFLRANLSIDFIIKCGCGKENTLISESFYKFISTLVKQRGY